MVSNANFVVSPPSLNYSSFSCLLDKDRGSARKVHFFLPLPDLAFTRNSNQVNTMQWTPLIALGVMAYKASTMPLNNLPPCPTHCDPEIHYCPHTLCDGRLPRVEPEPIMQLPHATLSVHGELSIFGARNTFSTVADPWNA